ncbi:MULTISPECIES: M20 family metallopeptidase [Haloferax]|uniref:M20/M25/M40 family metallo-hydrolase n=2 Tax=Haloferax TaxID=2251 RepID=A0A6G1Z5X2_9EURY|nr:MULTISPECIES: M20/M25/M40 family metallo-hydrolase [Haloferax]KAB1185323.1 M20 family metallopeptidase [Haloferax sp. CBA1149]MRW81959.1 M20/M25/M40 family metallo-hydrolase [Haloferax marinisediminis]
MTTVAELTRELVSISSHEDETAAGDFIEKWLREETAGEVVRDDVGNVIARRGTGETSLALVGHHDVVAPAASQTNDEGEYIVEERDGRLYGRGTADMKGSVAAAMLAFRDADPSCELVFASFVGEETGGTGATHAINEGFAPDFAIVGEGSTNYSKPGVTDVVVAHKGGRGSTITVEGEPSHASEPSAGVNAIYRATEAIDLIRDLPRPHVEVFGEELSGTAVVTQIHDGGNASNVIPGQCTLTVDERTVPGERVDLSQVENIDGVEWTVNYDGPPMRCDDEAFAETVLAAAVDAQDGEPELTTKPHVTDAGRLVGAGVTCVVCGASEPGEAHTDTESANLEVLERCYRIYRGTAERL